MWKISSVNIAFKKLFHKSTPPNFWLSLKSRQNCNFITIFRIYSLYAWHTKWKLAFFLMKRCPPTSAIPPSFPHPKWQTAETGRVSLTSLVLSSFVDMLSETTHFWFFMTMLRGGSWVASASQDQMVTVAPAGILDLEWNLYMVSESPAVRITW